MLGLGPEYLYLITVLDLRPERHDAPVELRPDRLVAKIGMHRIGEIHRRRTARKLDQLPLRGEGEHLSLEHGEPGVLQQFLRTCRMIEDFRSEEHTSELQSLMRISYAVFCLKTKTISCTYKHKQSTNKSE